MMRRNGGASSFGCHGEEDYLAGSTRSAGGKQISSVQA